MSDKIVYLECQCHSPEHSVKFILDNEEGEIYVYTQLTPLPWYKRIWHGIRYMFNKSSTWGHWEETILKEEEISQLLNIFTEYKQQKEKEKGSRWYHHE